MVDTLKIIPSESLALIKEQGFLPDILSFFFGLRLHFGSDGQLHYIARHVYRAVHQG